MSTDNLPDRRRKLTDLTIDERASIAQDIFIAKAKGQSVRSLAKQHNMSEYATRTLIAEYGAYLRETNTHTKEANIAGYDFVLENAAEIIQNPQNYSVLLQAKGYEAFIQALTRKDKLLGHEAPTHNINTKGETLSDLWGQMFGSQGSHEDISARDMTLIGQEEEIEDAIIVEEEDEDDSSGEQEDRPS